MKKTNLAYVENTGFYSPAVNIYLARGIADNVFDSDGTYNPFAFQWGLTYIALDMVTGYEMEETGKDENGKPLKEDPYFDGYMKDDDLKEMVDAILSYDSDKAPNYLISAFSQISSTASDLIDLRKKQVENNFFELRRIADALVILNNNVASIINQNNDHHQFVEEKVADIEDKFGAINKALDLFADMSLPSSDADTEQLKNAAIVAAKMISEGKDSVATPDGFKAVMKEVTKEAVDELKLGKDNKSEKVVDFAVTKEDGERAEDSEKKPAPKKKTTRRKSSTKKKIDVVKEDEKTTEAESSVE